MNDSIKKISLDIHSTSSGETVNAKRGDTARKIIISLVDGGLPYRISEDCYAVFTAKKPDGHVVYNDCTIVNNTIVYNMTPQTVAVEGRVNSEIKLYGADKKLITSPKFTILVYGTVYNEGDEVESSDEFNTLAALVDEAKDAIQIAQEMDASLVVKTESGAAVLIEDAAEHSLVGLRILGMTRQYGVPTPDAPVTMESAGTNGSVGIAIEGKNLLDLSAISFTRCSNSGGVLLSDITSAYYASLSCPYLSTLMMAYRGKMFTFSADKGIAGRVMAVVIHGTRTNGETYQQVNGESGDRFVRIQVADDFKSIHNVELRWNSSRTGLITDTTTVITNVQFEFGTVPTSFEPYRAKRTLTIPAANGLRGVPVPIGGNYIDENGQRWVCDEIDLDRGVYIERCRDFVMDGTTYFTVSEHANGQRYCAVAPPGLMNTTVENSKSVLSDRYAGTPWSNQNNNVYCIGKSMVITDSRFTDADTTLAILQTEKPLFRYVRATPVETALDEATTAAYKAMYTHRMYNAVTNGGCAVMEVEYAVDMKSYIDGLLKAPTPALLDATVE